MERTESLIVSVKGCQHFLTSEHTMLYACTLIHS